jgi:indole-3-glycerol phosphate synthase
VTTAEWARLKREQLQRIKAPDVRNVVPTVKDFSRAVSTRREELAVVAEIARATPEEGKLRDALDVAEVSRQLDSASAAALAVATDELACAAEGSDLAIVARDLILAREQLYHARLMGADAVLLTAAALSPADLRSSIEILASMHMAAPVEVSTESELSAALTGGAKLFVIPAFGATGLSLTLADSLLPKVPRGAIALVRGPFAEPDDFAPLRGRADGIWIAGPLMRADDPESLLERLVRAAESR